LQDGLLWFASLAVGPACLRTAAGAIAYRTVAGNQQGEHSASKRPLGQQAPRMLRSGAF